MSMLDLGAVLATERPRDIDTITSEILEAKRVGGQAILTIGRCLTEAKATLSHGEWLPWLSEKVEFSEATAQRFMRLARDWSNPSTLTDLGASKALALLALPAEERDAFMAQMHEVDGQEKTVIDMSARELDKAIRERKEALVAAEEEKAKAVAAEEARAKMEADMKLTKQLLSSAQEETAKAQEAVAQLQQQLIDLKAVPVEVAVMEVDQAALDKARAEGKAELQAALDKAKAKLEKADEKRKKAEADLLAAKSELEKQAQAERKAAIAGDKELAQFELLFQQGQENANKMAGILIKLRGREDTTTAEKVQKAMLALSGAIKEAAK